MAGVEEGDGPGEGGLGRETTRPEWWVKGQGERRGPPFFVLKCLVRLGRVSSGSSLPAPKVTVWLSLAFRWGLERRPALPVLGRGSGNSRRVRTVSLLSLCRCR